MYAKLQEIENKIIEVKHRYEEETAELLKLKDDTIMNLENEQLGIENEIIELFCQLESKITRFYDISKRGSLTNNIVLKAGETINSYFGVDEIFKKERIKEYVQEYELNEIYPDDYIEEYAIDNYGLMGKCEALNYAIEILRYAQ